MADRENEIKSLREEIASLRNKVQDMTSSATDSNELREKYQKVEKKLRGYAKHCQRLEEEKSIIKNALGNYASNKTNIDIERDYAGSVETVLEKLVTIQGEYNVLSGTEGQANLYLIQIDCLCKENQTLETNLANTLYKINNLI